MAAPLTELTITFSNLEDLVRFEEAKALVEEAADELPWRDDLRTAANELDAVQFDLTVEKGAGG